MPRRTQSRNRHGHPRRRRPNPIFALVYILVVTVFWAAAVTCFLLAAHRISRGLLMSGRAAALESAGDMMTDEEKRAVAEHLRHDALRRF